MAKSPLSTVARRQGKGGARDALAVEQVVDRHDEEVHLALQHRHREPAHVQLAPARRRALRLRPRIDIHLSRRRLRRRGDVPQRERLELGVGQAAEQRDVVDLDQQLRRARARGCSGRAAGRRARAGRDV